MQPFPTSFWKGPTESSQEVLPEEGFQFINAEEDDGPREQRLVCAALLAARLEDSLEVLVSVRRVGGRAVEDVERDLGHVQVQVVHLWGVSPPYH